MLQNAGFGTTARVKVRDGDYYVQLDFRMFPTRGAVHRIHRGHTPKLLKWRVPLMHISQDAGGVRLMRPARNNVLQTRTRHILDTRGFKNRAAMVAQATVGEQR